MSQTLEEVKAAQSAARKAEREASYASIPHPMVGAVRAIRERRQRVGPFPVARVAPGDRICVCGHDFGRPATRGDLIQHFALHRHEVHLYPCPECEARLPALTASGAPVEGCECRICRWLRENVKWEAERRG